MTTVGIGLGVMVSVRRNVRQLPRSASAWVLWKRKDNTLYVEDRQYIEKERQYIVEERQYIVEDRQYTRDGL